ncbi:hypothetical protein D3C81_2330800 [compost metagenome]
MGLHKTRQQHLAQCVYHLVRGFPDVRLNLDYTVVFNEYIPLYDFLLRVHGHDDGIAD